MLHSTSRGLAAFALFALGFSAGAQEFKIITQGAAEEQSQKNAAVARAMAQAVGQPAAGMGQVVFFRSSRSPGAAIDVITDDASTGRVMAGTYVAFTAIPGTHAYDPGNLPVSVKAGDTKYVQVIRNRAGQPQLLGSNAVRFQTMAERSK